ncbi:hypothetical protein AGMMS50262_14460 [Bacteroidia bacterium]|nr:hypothetical protein AGMMS50262_14460 [Bacteroidia bacterium]
MKIEFYKQRTLSERFSATAEFIRENGKLYLKNIWYIGVPLALLMGYFMHLYISHVFEHINEYPLYNPYAAINWRIYSLLLIVSFLLTIFLTSFTGSILYNYTKDTLPENAGWVDLKSKLWPFMGKISLLMLLFFAIIFIPSAIFGLITGFLILRGMVVLAGIIAIIFTLILFALIIVFLPFLMLIYYPILFENASVWQSIKKSIRLSFKNWGSTFGTGLLAILLVTVCYYIFFFPYLFYIMFNMGDGGTWGYVLAMIVSLILLILSPVVIVFMGFQYTSIVKKEEDKDFFQE